MSSYIAFELDALNVVPSVAAASGLRVGDISHGLLTMWAWCFREETDTVTAVHVRGFFGADCAESLMAFGFLASTDDGFKVRGADRYLRVKTAQREGGKKGRALSTSPVGTQTQTSGSTSRSTSGSTLKSEQALTPSTEHRTPNTEHQTAAVGEAKPIGIAAFHIEAPDPQAIESWTVQDFWRAFELDRRDAGYPPEKWPPPNSLRDWWQEARPAFDVQVLGMAVQAYLRDAHWVHARPACPWAGFAKQWTKFIPRKQVAS